MGPEQGQVSVQRASMRRNEPQVMVKLEVLSPKMRDVHSYLMCWLVSVS